MNEVKVNGVGGQLTVTKKRIIIERKGGLAMLSHGLSGTKEIPIKNITAVQFKSASKGMNGFLQFSLLGSNESKGGFLDAHSDENTITFSQVVEPNFLEIKRYIDSIIDEEPIELESLNILDLQEEGVSNKSRIVAMLLGLCFGMLGIDRFYLGNTGLGVAKLLTFGGLGFWALFDVFYIGLGKAKDGNGRKVLQ